jgi:replicative DNA helicase
MASIFSIETEEHVLSGILRSPEVFWEIANFVSEHDFFNETRNIIYCVLRDTISKGEPVDKVLIAQKIKNLGITFKDGLDIFGYIDTLIFRQVTPKATIEAAKELVKHRIRRELVQTFEHMTKQVREGANENIETLVSEIDSLYGKRISTYDSLSEPEDIFAGIKELVEERGNNPKDDMGYVTPFSEFNRLYGGLRHGNVYAVVSRPGQGKSTYLNDMSFGTSKISDFKVKSCVFDTEMFTIDVRFRRISALTGVPVWYLETGNWRKNPEMVKKVRDCWDQIKNYKQDHHQIGNKNIDQLCSIARRWYYSKVGRGNPAIICYDYIKLTGEKVGQNWAEHQAIGEKIDKLKKLSEELNVPILTAAQLNRSGENFNKSGGDFNDDSSAISLSDRLQWFASFVAIFRRKTLDEMALDGSSFGTHKLIPIKTRFQGKDAAGHIDRVRRVLPSGDEVWVNNYLNYEVKNFSVSERGSARDAANQQIVIHKPTKTDGSLV